MVASAAPPVACEYETPEGRACPNRARFRLTWVEAAARGISGEPVKYFCHSCHGHLDTAKGRAVAGIELESCEAL